MNRLLTHFNLVVQKVANIPRSTVPNAMTSRWWSVVMVPVTDGSVLGQKTAAESVAHIHYVNLAFWRRVLPMWTSKYLE